MLIKGFHYSYLDLELGFFLCHSVHGTVLQDELVCSALQMLKIEKKVEFNWSGSNLNFFETCRVWRAWKCISYYSG